MKVGFHRPLAPVARLPGRRFPRRRDILVVGCAVAAVLVAAVVATARQTPALGPQLACADVAASVGLQFTGDYGPVFPAMDANGALMQQNMGNGAAVGDYNGDGYLDVLLLGQAGLDRKIFV